MSNNVFYWTHWMPSHSLRLYDWYKLSDQPCGAWLFRVRKGILMSCVWLGRQAQIFWFILCSVWVGPWRLYLHFYIGKPTKTKQHLGRMQKCLSSVFNISPSLQRRESERDWLREWVRVGETLCFWRADVHLLIAAIPKCFHWSFSLGRPNRLLRSFLCEACSMGARTCEYNEHG